MSRAVHSSSPRPTTRDAALDALAALVVGAASLVLLAHGGLPLPNPHRVGIAPVPAVLTGATAVPLLLRRRWPLASVLLAALASMVLAVVGGLVWPPLGIGATVFLFARGQRDGSPNARSYLAPAGAVMAFLAVAAAVSPLAPVVHSAIVCVAAWLAGEHTRLRRAEVHELRLDAERAERERAREREVAVLEERTRIARDLHDTTAHTLNVITLRAGTARLRDDAAFARTVLADIEDLARETIREVDRVVANLRSPSATVEPPPGLAALERLVRQHSTAGHRISLSVDGSPGELPGPADQGAFRILQECLTNAGRHGNGVTDVRLAHGASAFAASVSNGYDGADRRRTGGHGLIGMRERAAAIGGELTIDDTDGRFTVVLSVPGAVAP